MHNLLKKDTCHFFAVSNFSSVIRIQISTEIKQKTLQELNCSIITAIPNHFINSFSMALQLVLKDKKNTPIRII